MKGDDDIQGCLSELFIVDPHCDFKIYRIGTFEEGLKEDDVFNYAFYGIKSFYVRSVDNEELIPNKFALKNDIFFIGKIKSVCRIDDGIAFFIIPVSEEEIVEGLDRIAKEEKNGTINYE